jgi:hypothetical protein
VVGERALLDACRHCFASLFTNRAISYREMQGFDHLKVALSIGVQTMVRAALEQLERAVALRCHGPTSALQWRTSSRTTLTSGGGTKLVRTSPCRTRSAIHSASFTSVLRPGRLRMCEALPTMSVKAPSSAAWTGCQ